MYLGRGPRWYKEIIGGTAALLPGLFEGLLLLGVPEQSTDPVLSAALFLVLSAIGIAAIAHGIRLGKKSGWQDPTIR